MQSDDMSVPLHPGNQIRMALGRLCHHKKAGRNVILLQQIQQLRRILRVRTIIEGKIQRFSRLMQMLLAFVIAGWHYAVTQCCCSQKDSCFSIHEIISSGVKQVSGQISSRLSRSCFMFCRMACRRIG